MDTWVGALIVEQDRILLVADENGWELPGAVMQTGEVPRQTALRAVDEQLDCTVTVRSPYSRFETGIDMDGERMQLRGFIASHVARDPDGRWMDEQDLLNTVLSPIAEKTRERVRLLLIRNR